MLPAQWQDVQPRAGVGSHLTLLSQIAGGQYGQHQRDCWVAATSGRVHNSSWVTVSLQQSCRGGNSLNSYVMCVSVHTLSFGPGTICHRRTPALEVQILLCHCVYEVCMLFPWSSHVLPGTPLGHMLSSHYAKSVRGIGASESLICVNVSPLMNIPSRMYPLSTPFWVLNCFCVLGSFMHLECSRNTGRCMLIKMSAKCPLSQSTGRCRTW